MSILVWTAVVLVVALASFIAGVVFGRGFWRDVTWLRLRR